MGSATRHFRLNLFTIFFLNYKKIFLFVAHPNVKVFISHGGMLSSIEAAYFGVPILGIPVFGDQKMNIAVTVSNGYGLSLPFQELSEEKLTEALNELLSNKKSAFR